MIENESMKKIFEDISILGRVAYALYGLEIYIKEQGEDFSEWENIFHKFWSFSEMEYIDDYMYKFVEYIPETVLEFDHYIKDDFEYMTEDEFYCVYKLYENCKCIDGVKFILECIEDILAYHMYSGNLPPAGYSLNIVSEKIYPFFQNKLRKKPEIELFKIYSIYEENCWGEMHSKESVLKGEGE